MPDKKEKIDHKRNLALNTVDNAELALSTARATLSKLVPGRAWVGTLPKGEFEIKGALLLENKPVVILKFSPEDGSLLPRGLHALGAGRADLLPVVESRLSGICAELDVLEGAEFRAPESCWALPLVHRGRIVSHIKVSGDGTAVLADKKALEELA